MLASTPTMEIPKAELTEVRPGRIIFHRIEILGSAKPKLQLLFMHGTCASSSQYNGLLKELTNILDEAVVCHLFDAISCGRSPLVRDWDAYHTDQAVSDLDAVLNKQMDQSLPTILIGHSYAPTIIIRYIHRHGIPANIKACIFLSSGVSGDANPIPNGGHPIFRLPVFVLRCLQPSLTKSFLQLAYHPKSSAVVIQEASASNSGNDMYMAKAFHTHHQWATQDECHSLHGIPVLVIHGKDDKILPAEAGAHLADVVKAQRFLTIEDTSHQVMEEKPKDVAQLIVRFLKDIKLV
jgi:pimeloyl-ACP methyl ester carboxylesterase